MAARPRSRSTTGSRARSRSGSGAGSGAAAFDAGSGLRALKAQYLWLDRNFNRIFLASRSDAERDRLRREYVTARDNFWEARARAFAADDPLVDAINGELRDAQAELERMVARLDNVPALLRLVTAAVQLGSSLVTLGSSPL